MRCRDKFSSGIHVSWMLLGEKSIPRYSIQTKVKLSCWGLEDAEKKANLEFVGKLEGFGVEF